MSEINIFNLAKDGETSLLDIELSKTPKRINERNNQMVSNSNPVIYIMLKIRFVLTE